MNKSTMGSKLAETADVLPTSPKKLDASVLTNMRSIEPRQLKKADELLMRIERRGVALSVSADKLLRRIS